MLDMLRAAGMFGYLVFGLGVLALPAAIVAAWWGLKRMGDRQRFLLGLGCLFVAVLLFGLGVVGYLVGMSHVAAALAAVDPAQVDRLREVGVSEARHNLTLGAMAAVAPALAGIALVLKGKLRKAPPA